MNSNDAEYQNLKFKLSFRLEPDATTNDILDLWNQVDRYIANCGNVRNAETNHGKDEEYNLKALIYTGYIHQRSAERLEQNIFKFEDNKDYKFMLGIKYELLNHNSEQVYYRDYNRFIDDLNRILSDEDSD